MRESRVSLRTQLTAVIFGAVLAALAATTSLFVYFEAIEAEEEALDLAQTVVRVLAQDFVRVVLLDSPDLTVDMVAKLEAFPTVVSTLFLDNTNTPVLAYTRPGAERIDLHSPDPQQGSYGDGHTLIETPISYLGEVYGKALFRVRLDDFGMHFRAFLRSLLFTVPLFLLLSFLLALLFQRILSRPILQLVKALGSFGRGANPELSLEGSPNREVTSLFRGFQKMAARVVETQKALDEQRERLLVTLESIADGVVATDSRARVRYMNPAAEEITGWSRSDAVGKGIYDIYQLIDEETGEPLRGHLDQVLISNGGEHLRLEQIALRTRGGNTLSIQSSIAPIRDQTGKVSGAVVIFRNVTEAREFARQLHHQATHDPLTELVNRSEFERRLNEAMTSAQHDLCHALLYLDLDQFKLINDTSGHVAGDALLIQIAVLLRHSVRETDTVARLGGDEFAVLLPNCSLQRAREVAEKIRLQINDFTFVWGERNFRIGASIGVVPVDDHRQPTTQILSSADIACYAAKDLGRNRIHVYHAEDTELRRRHGEMQWTALIGEALEQDRLRLFAQKIVCLDRTRPLTHIEILLRYIDSNGTAAMPGAFLPAVERYGLAPSVDRWVIRQVLQNTDLIAHLKSVPGLRVNINLSGLTLGDATLVDYVSALLQHARLPPKSICFEITETAAVANLAATSRFMRSMKLLGCEFALDDFGSGVSSFAYLKNLPVDYLKIDGGFVRDVHRNEVNRALLGAINQVGHVMGIKTVAEFVENRSIVRVLEELGVDFAQGHHIHEPCPLEDIYHTPPRESGASGARTSDI